MPRTPYNDDPQAENMFEKANKNKGNGTFEPNMAQDDDQAFKLNDTMNSADYRKPIARNKQY